MSLSFPLCPCHTRTLPRHSRNLPRHSRNHPRHSRVGGNPPRQTKPHPPIINHQSTICNLLPASHLTKQNPRTILNLKTTDDLSKPHPKETIMQSPICNHQFPNPPSTEIDTIQQSPTNHNENSCPRVTRARARGNGFPAPTPTPSYVIPAGCPRHSRTLPRHSREGGNPPRQTKPHPHNPQSPIINPQSPIINLLPASHLTKQNPRTTLDPWPLQQNHTPRRQSCNLQSPILPRHSRTLPRHSREGGNPPRCVHTPRATALLPPSTEIDKTRQNPAKSDGNSCARVP